MGGIPTVYAKKKKKMATTSVSTVEIHGEINPNRVFKAKYLLERERECKKNSTLVGFGISCLRTSYFLDNLSLLCFSFFGPPTAPSSLSPAHDNLLHTPKTHRSLDSAPNGTLSGHKTSQQTPLLSPATHCQAPPRWTHDVGSFPETASKARWGRSSTADNWWCLELDWWDRVVDQGIDKLVVVHDDGPS